MLVIDWFFGFVFFPTSRPRQTDVRQREYSTGTACCSMLSAVRPVGKFPLFPRGSLHELLPKLANVHPETHRPPRNLGSFGRKQKRLFSRPQHKANDQTRDPHGGRLLSEAHALYTVPCDSPGARWPTRRWAAWSRSPIIAFQNQNKKPPVGVIKHRAPSSDCAALSESFRIPLSPPTACIRRSPAEEPDDCAERDCALGRRKTESHRPNG